MEDISVLVTTFLKTKNKENMQNLLQGLLTPSETKEFAMRIAIVRMLKQGIAHHAIAKKLGIGVATVTRGAREIKQGNFKYV